MSNSKRLTASVIGTGGLGANIVQGFTNLPDDDPNKPFFVKAKKHIIDTSDSNIRNVSKDISVSIISGLTGAGKQRSHAYENVMQHVNTLLTDHKVADINYLITSLSGGSGSIIAPLLASAILQRNKPVIIIGVGSTTSAIETENTIKTLQSLQQMATTGKTGGKAIPIIYLENANISEPDDYRDSRMGNDVRIEAIIRQLGLLFAGNHRELDMTDLYNWLDYTKTSPDIKPQLVEVMIFKDNEPMDAHRDNTIGTASLLCSDNDPVPELNQPYSCVGYFSDQILEETKVPNHHYVLTFSRIPHIFRRLEESADVYRNAKQALKEADVSGLMGDIGEQDTGIIL